jgi:hypothetical protein
MAELKTRLTGRKTEAEEAVQKRLATAIKEIEYATSGAHDIVIINDNLDVAYKKFEKVALGEEQASDVLPPLLEAVNGSQDEKRPIVEGTMEQPGDMEETILSMTRRGLEPGMPPLLSGADPTEVDSIQEAIGGNIGDRIAEQLSKNSSSHEGLADINQ